MSKIFYVFLVLAAFGAEAFVFLKMTKPQKPKIDIVHSQESVQPEEPKQTSIILTGDIMLGRSVMTESIKLNNYKYPFEKVAETLKKADLVFSNLENPIIADCPQTNSGMIFCADPKMIEGLTYAGIDVVNLANNHTRNYGQEGFDETKKFLGDSGISYVGDNNLTVKEINGTKFGFLGFDFVTNKLSDEVLGIIKESSARVDILIVGVHWGNEYQDKASKIQMDTGQKMIESGADVIAGHHPHWVQNSEIFNGKPIYYSLGNFIFDQMWSAKTKKGMAMRLTFTDKEYTSEEQLPIIIKTIGQPEWDTAK